jgi:beta-phosphoglucomutase-like phosphatase (HAD superfamily)
MKNIRGLIFDCDGTIADTMPFHWKAWQVITERHNLHFPMDRFYSLGGVPTRDILKMLGEEQKVAVDHLLVSKEKEAAYLPFLRNVQPIECILRYAREHHETLPCAVASGGSKHIIENVLATLGIRHFFKAVVTSEDVQRQKPAPDIYLEAARRIGVPPEFCRGFEDTDLGMEGLRAAGMEAIDVRPLIEQARRTGSCES